MRFVGAYNVRGGGRSLKLWERHLLASPCSPHKIGLAGLVRDLTLRISGDIDNWEKRRYVWQTEIDMGVGAAAFIQSTNGALVV